MSEKFFKCTCAHCGGHLEYPADGIGETIPCPHCGQPTELTFGVPEISSAPSGRSLKWGVAGIVILILGIVGVVGALNAARHFMEKGRVRRAAASPVTRMPKTAPVAVAPQILNDFAISPVVLDKSSGSTLLHAAGSLENKTDRQRFGVTVEIDLFDSAETRIGSAQDYVPLLEPRALWKFRALLVKSGVTSARVANVREQL